MKQCQDANRVVRVQNQVAESLSTGNREAILTTTRVWRRYMAETDVDVVVRRQSIRMLRPLVLQVLADIRRKNALVFDLSEMD
jgi:hypothetical protein